MNLNLIIWRQNNNNEKGRFVKYPIQNISPEMSFLEMLDFLNEELILKNEEPIAFDHDCREGICGACSMVINGVPHGPLKETTTCQLHMRNFKDGDTVFIEPFRAKAFPIIKDLVVDRSALDNLIISGGYISVNTGSAPEASTIPVAKEKADKSFAAANCIGCGACVASCKNASAMLFLSSKIIHLASLPQGKIESKKRIKDMITKMDDLGFGSCSNTGTCAAVCPKGIELSTIVEMNRQFFISFF